MALGDLLFRAGHFERAEAMSPALVEKLQEVPDKDSVREIRSSAELLYGAILLAQGKSGEGVARWVKSMEIDPNFALANGSFISRSTGMGWLRTPKLPRRLKTSARLPDWLEA
jgi:hypothetical protein